MIKNKHPMTKEIQLPSGRYLLIEVPEEAIRFWLHFNVVCYGTKTGFGEAHNHGEVFTERQMLESLEVTHEIIGKGNELNNGDSDNNEMLAYLAENDTPLSTTLILKLTTDKQ